MKYSLLAAALVLILTGCDQLRQKEPGEGKPGQYPPSLWEKREGQVSDADIEAAQKAEAEAAAAQAKKKAARRPVDKAGNGKGKFQKNGF